MCMLSSIYHPPNPLVLGILGGGQLAKMMAQAAFRMGLHVAVIEHGENSPAGIMTKLDYPLGWSNAEALEAFVKVSDVITLENEFIDPDLLSRVEEKRLVFPSSVTMRLIQDKYQQKLTFSDAGIRVPVFAAVHCTSDAVDFGNKNGYPFILKSRKYGYDGYGNAIIHSALDIESAWLRLSRGEQPRELMAEQFISFSAELAVMVARNGRGETAVYPCVQTIQQGHICVSVIAPAPVDEAVHTHAQALALQCVETIGGIGVFGIEMFLTDNDEVIFNEIAPRPHNSGHYTIEACHTSQFENCIRAVLNLPLGNPAMRVNAAAMINLLGERSGAGIPDSVVDMLKVSDVALHLYGKNESRKGRKMGHLTATADTPPLAFSRANEALNMLIW